jgi:hypothetical protein
VPAWAAKAVVAINIGGARIDRVSSTVNGNAAGQIRAILGTVPTQGTAYDLDAIASTITARFNVAAGDTIVIPASMRGTNQTLKIQGLKAGGTSNLYADTATFATVDVEFQEAAA